MVIIFYIIATYYGIICMDVQWEKCNNCIWSIIAPFIMNIKKVSDISKEFWAVVPNLRSAFKILKLPLPRDVATRGYKGCCTRDQHGRKEKKRKKKMVCHRSLIIRGGMLKFAPWQPISLRRLCSHSTERGAHKVSKYILCEYYRTWGGQWGDTYFMVTFFICIYISKLCTVTV